MRDLGSKGAQESRRKRAKQKIEWLHRVDVEDLLELMDCHNVSQATADEVKFSCPFPGHTSGDTTPSAFMNTGERDRNKTSVWKCHGCGRSGNAVSFVAELENISKQRAMLYLRDRYAPDWRAPIGGIKQEFEERLKARRRAEKNVETEIPTYAWEWYDERYGLDWPLGASASDFPGTPMAYMYERGFTSKTLNEWRIGYDEISDRIAIPVANEAGELVGIKARSTEEGRKPKYLVLGDKPGVGSRHGFPPYEKSLVVFGIDRIDDNHPVVFCEGELDVIALWQIGIPAICTGGAHLSFAQSILIRDHVSEGVVWLDNDPAGENATWGYDKPDGEHKPGLVEKLDPFLHVRIVRPHRFDPAEMVKLGKHDGVRRMIAQAKPAHRFAQYRSLAAL